MGTMLTQTATESIGVQMSGSFEGLREQEV